MTHEDAGHYAAKHPPGTELNPEIAAALKKQAREARISCAAAHKIARALQVEPSAVGVAIDLLEYRIKNCQLGLYGYTPAKKIVRPAETVSPDLAGSIRAEVDQGRIACRSCWQIAKDRNLPRMDVSAACEALAVKICRCQLGAF